MSSDRHALRPLHLFLALPLTAAFIITALPAADPAGGLTYTQLASFLFIILLSCVISLVIGDLVGRITHDYVGHPLMLPAVFLLIGGGVLFLLRSSLSLDSNALIILTAAMLGVGGSLLMLLWGWAYYLLEPGQVLINLACSFAVAAIVGLAIWLLLPGIDTVAAGIVLVLISTIPLELILTSPRSRSDVEVPTGGTLPADVIDDAIPDKAFGDGTPDSALLPAPETATRRLLAATWKPYFGVMLCWIIIACSWGTSFGSMVFTAGAPRFLLQTIGVLVAGIVMLTIVLVSADVPERLSTCLRFTPVVTAALLLLAWFLVLMNASLFMNAAGLITGFATGILCIVALNALITFSQSEHSPFRFLALAGAFLFSSLILFAVIGYLLVDGAEYITPVLTLIYLVLSNFDFGKQKAVEATTAPVETEDSLFDARLSELADEYHLTAREKEVLPLMARGHSANYIADTLCISFNTTRTHIRHVYEKLGVHTRDELIALMNIDGVRTDA